VGQTIVSQAKEAAGRRAAQFVKSGMTVGLGTGSTVYFTLVALGERVRDEGLQIRGVPTSVDTELKAREFGIPLATLAEVQSLDVTIDGADEIDASFNMIKGGGGALLREKVVAAITKQQVIVVGASKRVQALGSGFLLPVEVVPFARMTVIRRLESMGVISTVRMLSSDEPYLTDNFNEILDCRFPKGIADAGALDHELNSIPGVVENGLFVGLAHVLVVGDDAGGSEVFRKP
jgi:ribose 5-phosphate isomerase A